MIDQKTPISASKIKAGTTININGAVWIAKDVTKTRHSVVVEFEGYFNWDRPSGKTRLVFKANETVDEIPHPATW